MFVSTSRCPQIYSIPVSMNATGLQITLTWIVCSFLFTVMDAEGPIKFAKISFVDEATIVYRQITADKLEIDMPPGLRPIGGKSDVGRDVLGRVEAEWRPGVHGSIHVADKPKCGRHVWRGGVGPDPASGG